MVVRTDGRTDGQTDVQTDVQALTDKETDRLTTIGQPKISFCWALVIRMARRKNGINPAVVRKDHDHILSDYHECIQLLSDGSVDHSTGEAGAAGTAICKKRSGDVLESAGLGHPPRRLS